MAALRILIVKLSAVGDVVHTLPALTALRRAFPDAHIGWAVHAGPGSLLEKHPFLDERIIVPRKGSWAGLVSEWSALRRRLREDLRSWDIAIDFQGLTKSGLVAWLSGAPRRIGFAGTACRELNALFTNIRVRPHATPVIQMNLELLAPLGVTVEKAEATFATDESDAEAVASWARAKRVVGERFFVLDPFAGWVTKTWPIERWIEVARRVEQRYGFRSLVFFGPNERPEAEKLANAICSAGAHALVAPDTTLRQLVILLREHAALFAGGDTGPMHIAAALGVPTVALFGSSDSRRNAPVFANARFEILQDFSQPCAGTFARTCRHHAPHHCLDGIYPAEVLERIERLVAENLAKPL